MTHTDAKPLVLVGCLLPGGLLVWNWVTGGLGANPIEAITHTTGDWTLRFLLVTLAMTPLRCPLHMAARRRSAKKTVAAVRETVWSAPHPMRESPVVGPAKHLERLSASLGDTEGQRHEGKE